MLHNRKIGSPCNPLQCSATIIQSILIPQISIFFPSKYSFYSQYFSPSVAVLQVLKSLNRPLKENGRQICKLYPISHWSKACSMGQQFPYTSQWHTQGCRAACDIMCFGINSEAPGQEVRGQMTGMQQSAVVLCPHDIIWSLHKGDHDSGIWSWKR